MASVNGGRMGLILILIAIGLDQSNAQQCDAAKGWKTYGTSCFYVETGKGNYAVSWHVARDRCQAMGADLAVPKTKAEAQFLETMSKEHDSEYHASLWLGITNREDYDTWMYINGDRFTGAANWKELWYWAFPRADRTKRCAYQHHTTSAVCYNQVPGIEYVKSVVKTPLEAQEDGVNTFTLGMIFNPTDNDCDLCEKWCLEKPSCDRYTFFSEVADETWRSWCVGMRGNVSFVGNPYPWACSGMKVECSADGQWHNDNCGVNRGYACQKPSSGVTVPTPEPTPATQGFCPMGYFEYGNKCFLIKETWESGGEGYTWREALQECEGLADKGVKGLRPTLASFHSEAEMSAVAMQLHDRHNGFWIGLYRETDNQHWVWADNSRFDFNKARYPLHESGSFACGEMPSVPGPIGSWLGSDCSAKKGLVCQMHKDPQNPVSSTSPIFTGLNCGKSGVGFKRACYRQLTDHLPWHDAEKECVKIGGHLVSIADGAENAAMVYHFTRFLYDSEGLWFGFSVDATREWKFVDYYPVGYTNWSPGYPTEALNRCGVMSPDGSWTTAPCDSTDYRPICKINFGTVPTHRTHIDGTCLDDSWYPFGQHCYWFSTSRKSWDDAEKDCKEKTSTADLVSIHSYEENQMIFKEFAKDWNTGVWLGRRSFGKDLPFIWTDNSADQYVKFKVNEPNISNGTRLCIVMGTTGEYVVGYWFATSCGINYKYACKAPKMVGSTIPGPRGTTTKPAATVPGMPTEDALTGEEGDGGGLSGGAIAGIIIGIVLAAGLVGAAVWFVMRRAKSPGGLGGTPGDTPTPANVFENQIQYKNMEEDTGASA